MTEKRVRITVEVDQSYVRLLSAEVTLSGLRDKDKLTPSQVLALAGLAEMRGGLETEVDLLIPNEWRPNFEVIHSERRVREIAEAQC